MMNTDTVQQSYRDSKAHVRGTFEDNPQGAMEYYGRYATFLMNQLVNRPAKILDIGCGNGWSTLLMRREHHEAYGADLHAKAPESWQVDPEFPYVAADGQALPFVEAAFDAVGLYQVLEHVPDPERMLRECLRVLRPAGRLIVVSPHLLSIGVVVQCVVRPVQWWAGDRRGARFSWPFAGGTWVVLEKQAGDDE